MGISIYVYIYISSINIYIYNNVQIVFIFGVYFKDQTPCSFFHVETVCVALWHYQSMHFPRKLFWNTVLNVLCMSYTDGGY